MTKPKKHLCNKLRSTKILSKKVSQRSPWVQDKGRSRIYKLHSRFTISCHHKETRTFKKQISLCNKPHKIFFTKNLQDFSKCSLLINSSNLLKHWQHSYWIQAMGWIIRIFLRISKRDILWFVLQVIASIRLAINRQHSFSRKIC